MDKPVIHYKSNYGVGVVHPWGVYNSEIEKDTKVGYKPTPSIVYDKQTKEFVTDVTILSRIYSMIKKLALWFWPDASVKVKVVRNEDLLIDTTPLDELLEEEVVNPYAKCIDDLLMTKTTLIEFRLRHGPHMAEHVGIQYLINNIDKLMNYCTERKVTDFIVSKIYSGVISPIERFIGIIRKKNSAPWETVEPTTKVSLYTQVEIIQIYSKVAAKIVEAIQRAIRESENEIIDFEKRFAEILKEDMERA